MKPFREEICAIIHSSRPSSSDAFPQMKLLLQDVELRERRLDNLYTEYQACMHATRVAVYHLPHLDRPDLRMRKLKIILDDDNPISGASHHHQLRIAWTELLGHAPAANDAVFGVLTDVAQSLGGDIGEFVNYVDQSYRCSLGPWLVIEGHADNWLASLLDVLSEFHPNLSETAYFQDSLVSGLERDHAREAFALAEAAISAHPHILDETLQHARETASRLNSLWHVLQGNMERIS